MERSNDSEVPKSTAQQKKDAKREKKMAKFEAKQSKLATEKIKATTTSKKKTKEKPREDDVIIPTTDSNGKKGSVCHFCVSYNRPFFSDVSQPMPETYSPRYVESLWYDWWEKSGFFNPDHDVRVKSFLFIVFF